jgi:hypothetical protein
MRTENIFRQFYTVALWDGTCPTYHFVTPNSTSNAASGGVNLPWVNPRAIAQCKIRKNFKPCQTLQGFFFVRLPAANIGKVIGFAKLTRKNPYVFSSGKSYTVSFLVLAFRTVEQNARQKNPLPFELNGL